LELSGPFCFTCFVDFIFVCLNQATFFVLFCSFFF